MPAPRRFVRLAVLVTLLVPVVAATRLDARTGAVATEHPLAAEAGATILRAGGSAVDAAIAAAAAVCVVHASSCGIGGGGFALVRTADGNVLALDYRETAPAGATPDRFLVDGKPDPSRTVRGGLAVAVPGEVSGWIALHRKLGTLPLATVLAPAIRLAREGVPLSENTHLRDQITRARSLLEADPGLRAVFLGANGEAPTPDARIVQADLAATLDRVAHDGIKGFLAAADAIAAAVKARGGVMNADDVRDYRPQWRDPLEGTFDGRRIVTFPPPGSGGVVLEILGILGGDDLAAMDPGARAHLLAGAMAQGFADRATWYGDTNVPVKSLLEPQRLQSLRARIPPDRVIAPTVAMKPDAGTAHVSVVDGYGNAVAITTTINTSFGAGIMVPGTGIILNNEMDDFALPGVANVYGLTGSTANAIAPGKRPQSSMSPTIVLDEGRPELVVGGSGGPLIISGVVQTILNVVTAKQPLRDAVDAPRIHDQGVPPRLAIERGLPQPTRDALTKVGHTLTEIPAIGAVAAAGLGKDGTPAAAGDRRKDGGDVVVR